MLLSPPSWHRSRRGIRRVTMRKLLPQQTYQCSIGHQLLSVIGRNVRTLLDEYAKYVARPNPSAARRAAAARITTRPQSRMQHATDVLAAKSATVVIRRLNGNTE